MMFHGYDLVSDWKNSQCGQTAVATKRGKKYFLKKYQTPVAPLNNGTLDAKTFAHNQELFNKFVATRKGVNTTIRTIAGAGGNIVIPCDEFIEGNQYVEAAEFVDGAISDDETEAVLASLSTDVKKLLMQTAAGALFSVHSKGIIHSDLKLKNVLLVRNKTGNYVAKLIDFDSSYFVDDKPDEIVGTIDYYSPELGEYADSEDEREEIAKKITEKSDIFSLGLIFHYYLAGALPEAVSLTEKLEKRKAKGKVVYCWIMLNSGCELKISPEIKSHKYASLIRDMLNKDPDARPTASEVLKRLREAEPVIEEPWPEHSLILDREAMKTAGVCGMKKVNTDGKHSYELLYGDGRTVPAEKDDIISLGFMEFTAPVGFCEPWAEHDLVFDTEKLNHRGFVSGEQKEMGGIKGYQLYRADSNSMFFKPEMLIAMKYAVPSDHPDAERFRSAAGAASPAPAPKPVSAPAPEPASAPTPAAAPAPAAETTAAPEPEMASVPSSICEPWEDHKIVFNEEGIRAKGFVSCERTTLGGVNGYNFYTADGNSRFIRQEMAVIQKLASKTAD